MVIYEEKIYNRDCRLDLASDDVVHVMFGDKEVFNDTDGEFYQMLSPDTLSLFLNSHVHAYLRDISLEELESIVHSNELYRDALVDRLESLKLRMHGILCDETSGDILFLEFIPRKYSAEELEGKNIISVKETDDLDSIQKQPYHYFYKDFVGNKDGFLQSLQHILSLVNRYTKEFLELSFVCDKLGDKETPLKADVDNAFPMFLWIGKDERSYYSLILNSQIIDALFEYSTLQETEDV